MMRRLIGATNLQRVSPGALWTICQRRGEGRANRDSIRRRQLPSVNGV